MLYNFLFPTKPDTAKVSLLLLAVRIIFGLLLMNHGIQKWSSFQEMSTTFPDPLGVGSPISLGLAIFGELVCSMAFLIGFLYRLAMTYRRVWKDIIRRRDVPVEMAAKVSA